MGNAGYDQYEFQIFVNRGFIQDTTGSYCSKKNIWAWPMRFL